MSQPRSAYIHVPFCRHRCGYCNFTLVSGRDDLISAYLDALEAEMKDVLGRPTAVDTLFLGGGTPSYLSPAELERLLRIATEWLQLLPGGEFSCEANPLDCSEETLQLLRAKGCNRISLGGQSFSDSKLRMLERDHSGKQLRAVIDLCSDYFPNVSLDLIFAAPDELLDDWRDDIRAALSSPVQHLSTYGLTIERGSAFYGRMLKHHLKELDSDLQLAMYEYAIDTLSSAGWTHYEVSNFARDGFRCRHNEAYWLGQPWWAFGPGAASFRHSAEENCFIRTVNHRSTTTYIRRQLAGRSPIAETEPLTVEQRVRERLVFGLRRLSGVALSELDTLWSGQARPLFEPFLTEYLNQGWLELNADCLRLTRRGLMISDSLWPDLLHGR